MLMSPHLLPFSANLSFQKRNGAKSGEYRGRKTAKPFYRILTMAYEVQTHTLFGLSLSYILKQHISGTGLAPFLGLLLVKQLPPHDDYLHCN